MMFTMPKLFAVLAQQIVVSDALAQRELLLKTEQPRVPSFEAFLELHEKSYAPEEFESRRGLFNLRVKEAAQQNARPGRLWTAGVNHLADWTAEELAQLRGWRGHASHGTAHGLSLAQQDSFAPVESHLWNASVVGKAEDQGQCGSCWAVAAAKMASTNYRIHTGKARSFSAQELVDCVPNPDECGGQGGCQGATVELAMLHLDSQGLATTEDTPYLATDSRCRNAESLLQRPSLEDLTSPGTKRASGSGAKALGLSYWERLPVNDDAALAARLLKGAVAVSVAGHSWSSYFAGIFDGCDRDAVIDHAVTAVGFGAEKGNRYWSILNSWGPWWGEAGSIRLLRQEDYCGVDRQPEMGTGCKKGPASVRVCGMCGVLYDSVYAQFEA